jgi:hypothetical protein
MGHTRKILVLGSFLLLAGFLSGCKKSDGEALASIGHKLAERAEGFSDQIQKQWSILPGHIGLGARVKNRLRWDKNLADCTIEVVIEEKNVELKGTVASPDQVQRAMELAQSTVDVEKVVNSLQVGGP